MRGVDFGHWAKSGEKIDMIRIFNIRAQTRIDANQKILLLPPVGRMPGENLDELRKNFYQEMQNYFPVPIVYVSTEGRLSDYLKEENLIIEGDIFDLQEAGRVGRLLGVSYVLCVYVREFRPYCPQVLSLYLALVETVSCNAVAEMSAVFDASEQQVVEALSEHLQSRRARKYDVQNLHVMLRSPSEYGAFVSAQCSRALANELCRKNELKERDPHADRKGGA